MEERVTDARLLWMAGFFDGEGYVGLQILHNRNLSGIPKIALRLSVSNTDRRSLTPFADRFGGSIVRSSVAKPRRKQVYRWDQQGKRAHQFMLAVRPFLITKTEQVDLAIRFWELPWRGVKGQRAGAPRGEFHVRDSDQIVVEMDMARQLQGMKRA